MKIGLLLNTPALSPCEVVNELDFIKNTGSRHFEIVYDHPITHEKLSVVEKFLKSNKDFTSAVHAPFVYTDILSISDEHRKYSLDEIKKAIVFAKHIKSVLVVFHAGKITGYNKNQLNYDAFTKLVNFAEAEGVSLAVENMSAKAGFIRSNFVFEKEGYELFEKYPSLMMCLDAGHTIQAGEDVMKFIEKFHEKIINIHLHDADIDTHKGHMALGRGKLNTVAFLRKLKEFEYDGYITLETLNRKDSLHSYNVVNEILKLQT